MLGVGVYFFKQKLKSDDDYYVGRQRSSTGHIGLSVVATDVGGGFSIGLVAWDLSWVFLEAGCCLPD